MDNSREMQSTSPSHPVASVTANLTFIALLPGTISPVKNGI
ncbi:MAG: hypothetical protein PHD55_11095 [Methanoregula sp.]|nr:hypothetical protein [Methanoregula sp.]